MIWRVTCREDDCRGLDRCRSLFPCRVSNIGQQPQPHAQKYFSPLPRLHSLSFRSLLTKSEVIMAAPNKKSRVSRVSRTTPLREQKLQERRAKFAEDKQRKDGTAIKDTDVSKWVPLPVSWGYEHLIHIAVRRFKDFLDIMGPTEPRSKICL